MASNFQILSRRDKNELHLNLMGDFDGSSAHELINTLEEKCDRAAKVFIHTKGLKSVHPFGKEVFQNNLFVLKRQSDKLVFTGRHDDRNLAPDNA